MSDKWFGLPPVLINKRYTAAAAANDQVVPWSISGFANKVWPKSKAGAGIKVGIVDTGIDQYHVEKGDLRDCVIAAKDFTKSKYGVRDMHGHGTHVAGTVAANNNDIGVVGTAYNSKLIIAKALGDQGQGMDTWIASAIVWCVDTGANLINCSLGGPSRSKAISDAIAYAVKNGVIVVCAAGNEGRDNSVGYPGGDPRVIAVGAIDKNNKIAPFSSRGAEVDVVAPGVNIFSCYQNGGYGDMSGTSMACPWKTGVLANLLSFEILVHGRRITVDYKTALEMYKRVCIDLGAAGHDPAYGYGMVDLDKMFSDPTVPTKPQDPVPPNDQPSKDVITNGDVTAVKARWGDHSGLFVYRSK